MEEFEIVGKIDLEKLGKYKKIVSTEKVILTRERKQHIIDKHKEHYSLWKEEIEETLYNPDYILEEGQHEDTIIILKEIIKEDKRIKIIIKLEVNNFENRYNSIITLWNIRKRDYNKTIEKNKIIYEKLDNKE